MKTYLRIISYMKPYRPRLVAVAVLTVLYIIFSVASIGTMMPFLDILFDTKIHASLPDHVSVWNADSIKNFAYYHLLSLINEHGRLTTLYIFCAVILIAFFLKNVFRYLSSYLFAPVEMGIVRDLRKDIFHHLTTLPLSYFSKERKGDLMSRVISDVQVIQDTVVATLQIVIRNPVTVIAFLLFMFFLNWKLTLFVLILLPVSGYIIGQVAKSLRKDARKGQHKIGGLLSILEEALTGMRIVQAFNAEAYERDKFNRQNNFYNQLMVSVSRKNELAPPMTEFLSSLVIIGLVVYSGHMIISGNLFISPSFFLVYIGIFSQILPPLKDFSQAYNKIQRGTASAERIFAVMDTKNIITEIEKPVAKKSFESSIEFRSVSFRYKKNNVLENISFTIHKGETVALVGPSGSGKSTVANLIPRFYDPQEGEILMDGIPVRELKLSDLRGLIGVVTQEAILFHDTIYNNIIYGRNHVSEEDVFQAAGAAHAHDFILESPSGYYTNIGDRGLHLSGGQRQRICIARAILNNPPILILDEATSALDTESERLVQDALQELMKNRTALVIAHRLSTIQNADKILVIDRGKIVEAGNHQQLYEHGGLYKKLCDFQTV